MKALITNRTKRWSSDLQLGPPIRGKDISNFYKWINWNGFRPNKPGVHPAFDFAAYVDKKGRCFLGLPEGTPVRAVADGQIFQICWSVGNDPYYAFINIVHSRITSSLGNGLISRYCHVEPLVEEGQKVKRGEVIATLYKERGLKAGSLVHLHFETWDAVEIRPREADPAQLFVGLDRCIAIPQGQMKFKLATINPNPPTIITNFKSLLLIEVKKNLGAVTLM